MASTSLCCPKCAAILKMASRPADGKKIKCPKCAAMFVAAENEVAENANAIKSKPDRRPPSAAIKGRPTRDDDDDHEAEELPRSRKSRVEKDDDSIFRLTFPCVCGEVSSS